MWVSVCECRGRLKSVYTRIICMIFSCSVSFAIASSRQLLHEQTAKNRTNWTRDERIFVFLFVGIWLRQMAFCERTGHCRGQRERLPNICICKSAGKFWTRVQLQQWPESNETQKSEMRFRICAHLSTENENRKREGGGRTSLICRTRWF